MASQVAALSMGLRQHLYLAQCHRTLVHDLKSQFKKAAKTNPELKKQIKEPSALLEPLIERTDQILRDAEAACLTIDKLETALFGDQSNGIDVVLNGDPPSEPKAKKAKKEKKEKKPAITNAPPVATADTTVEDDPQQQTNGNHPAMSKLSEPISNQNDERLSSTGSLPFYVDTKPTPTKSDIPVFEKPVIKSRKRRASDDPDADMSVSLRSSDSETRKPKRAKVNGSVRSTSPEHEVEDLTEEVEARLKMRKEKIQKMADAKHSAYRKEHQEPIEEELKKKRKEERRKRKRTSEVSETGGARSGESEKDLKEERRRRKEEKRAKKRSKLEVPKLAEGELTNTDGGTEMRMREERYAKARSIYGDDLRRKHAHPPDGDPSWYGGKDNLYREQKKDFLEMNAGPKWGKATPT